MMFALVAGFRFQAEMIRHERDYWLVFVTNPFFAVIFLAVVQHAGRPDLTGYAVLAPMLLTLWYTSLFIAGEIIDSDRWFGTLEPVIASPAAFPLVVLGRIMAHDHRYLRHAMVLPGAPADSLCRTTPTIGKSVAGRCADRR
jgi:ABC-2 type transport system permease protein